MNICRLPPLHKRPGERPVEVVPARHCGGSRCPPLVSPPLPPYWPFHLIWHRLRTKTKGGGAVSGHVGKTKAKIAASMCLDRWQFRDSEGNVCVLQVRNAVPPAGDRQSPGSRWSIKHPNRLLLASFNQTITCRREPKRPLTTCTLPGGRPTGSSRPTSGSSRIRLNPRMTRLVRTIASTGGD